MSDQEIKKRIMETAMEWFHKYGFSKVTMDELAEEMAMSKKTLYKYFSSKDELLQELVAATLKEMEHHCTSLTNNPSIDFVERLKQMMKYIAMQYSKIGRPLLEDLQKHVPHVWKQIDSFRMERIQSDFGSMLKEGRERGLFRTDIDEQLILIIYTNFIRNIINPDVLVQVPFSATQVFEAVIKIFYEGIFTEEGRAKYSARQTIQPEVLSS